jgi:hypothetical protein
MFGHSPEAPALRRAANVAWDRGDWRHASALMERLEHKERRALEMASGVTDPDDDIPF